MNPPQSPIQQRQQRNQDISTPSKTKTSEKLEEQVLHSPVRKDSRKKALINKALFKTSINILSFDDINCAPEIDKQSSSDFEVGVFKMESEFIQTEYAQVLTQIVVTMSVKEDISSFVHDILSKDALVVTSSKRFLPTDFAVMLSNLYVYIDSMSVIREIEIDELDDGVIASGRVLVRLCSGKIKDMLISTLFEGSQVTQIRLQFV